MVSAGVNESDYPVIRMIGPFPEEVAVDWLEDSHLTGLFGQFFDGL
jgi:hypothetical protein